MSISFSSEYSVKTGNAAIGFGPDLVELEKFVVVMVYIPLSWAVVGSVLIQGWQEMSLKRIRVSLFFFNRLEMRSFTSADKWSGML